MTLAMTRPWQHPKTGIFWLRKRVPKDLLPLVGKREEKLSLATRDPAEAKRRLIKALADVETRWTALRSKPLEIAHAAAPARATLSEREAHQRAEWMYFYWLEKHRDNPSGQTFWPLNAYDRLWNRDSMRSQYEWSVQAGAGDSALPVSACDGEALILEHWCFEQADLLLIAHEMHVDDDSRAKLAKALSASVHRASIKLARWAGGDFGFDGSPASTKTPREPIQVGTVIMPALPFEELIRGWAAEESGRWSERFMNGDASSKTSQSFWDTMTLDV